MYIAYHATSYTSSGVEYILSIYVPLQNDQLSYKLSCTPTSTQQLHYYFQVQDMLRTIIYIQYSRKTETTTVGTSTGAC